MLLFVNEYADPYKVVVAVANEEWRATVIDRLSDFCIVYDVFQNPDFLLPRLLEIPSFFIVTDYRIYKTIEPKLTDYHNPDIIENITPLLVYGVREAGLLRHPCIINGDSTHPRMVSSFFIDCRKKARNL